VRITGDAGHYRVCPGADERSAPAALFLHDPHDLYELSIT